jgi:hypothetical protein
MSAHLLQPRSARPATAPASALGPPRPFAAGTAATAEPAHAGHDLARVTVGPAEGSVGAAPIQRMPKVHHDPRKKPWLAKGMGARQVAVTAKKLDQSKPGTLSKK